MINNPIINSYKRLVPGYNAPVNISWSRKNRTPLMRITSTGEMGPRVALRSPDGSCNPYLVLAGCLAAGLEIVRRGGVAHVQIEMGVGVDEPRKQQHPGHVHHLRPDGRDACFVQFVVQPQRRDRAFLYRRRGGYA